MNIKSKKNLILVSILLVLIIVNIKIYSQININNPKSQPEKESRQTVSWSRNRQLTETEAGGSFAIDLTKNEDIFLIYADRKGLDENAAIYLEIFDRYGNPLMQTEKITSSSSVATDPFLYFITENTGIMGYRFVNNNIDDKIYRFTINDNNITYREIKPAVTDYEKTIKIYDTYQAQEGFHLALGIHTEDSLNKIKIMSFFTSLNYNITEIKNTDHLLNNPEQILLNFDNDKYHLFYLNPEVELSRLGKITIMPDGEITAVNNNIDKIGGDFSKPYNIQLLKTRNNFHLGWIEELSGMKTSHQFNYLLINNNGEITEKREQFLSTGGFSPGFAMTQNNSGNIEIYLARGSGSTTEYSNTGTDIYFTAFTPELQTTQPLRPIINSKGYEKYPFLVKQNGNKYLFWFLDREKGGEILFASTDQEIINYMQEHRTLKDKFSSYLTWTTDFLIKIVVAAIFTIVCSLLVFIAAIIYSFLGKYFKNNLLYWLTAVIFLFTTRLFNETILTSWQHPQYFSIYLIHLISLVLIIILISIYWSIISKKERPYRQQLLNKIIIVWVFIEGFIAYYSNLSVLYNLF